MALTGTPPPNRGLLHFTATIGFGGAAPIGALLHPLHHQVQQAGYRSFHISTCHRTRLKVGNTEKEIWISIIYPCGVKLNYHSYTQDFPWPFLWTSTVARIHFNNDVNMCPVTPAGPWPPWQGTAAPLWKTRRVQSHQKRRGAAAEQRQLRWLFSTTVR